tara:strand:- start:172 stop:405 length:234 start_codon:yes stop_codon:yes gene_type:complete
MVLHVSGFYKTDGKKNIVQPQQLVIAIYDTDTKKTHIHNLEPGLDVLTTMVKINALQKLIEPKKVTKKYKKLKEVKK